MGRLEPWSRKLDQKRFDASKHLLFSITSGVGVMFGHTELNFQILLLSMA